MTLPRCCTGSDIDMVLDNDGKILVVEFASKSPRWADVPRGQYRMYANLVRICRGNVVAVCAHHRDVEVIDTANDVLAFQVMTYRDDGPPHCSSVFPGRLWVPYVRHFFGLPMFAAAS